jgi:hypothetical protein
VLTGGDWNCYLDVNLDRKNYLSVENRPRTRQRLFEFMARLSLFDVARELYPDKRMFSWRKHKATKQARLDYFLINDTLLIESKTVKTIPGYRSDHSFVILSLNKDQFKRDRPFWKFNSSLLSDTNYVQEIKQIIHNTKVQYALPVYNVESIDGIPNDEIQFTINDQLFFETLLMEIRGKSISYACYKKKEETKLEKELEEKIQKYENNLTEMNVQELEQFRTQLETLRKKRIDGNAIRSRVRWINDGEKNSKYFCNLENRNYLDKALHCVQKESGEIITAQEKILAETKLFYEQLYQTRNVEEIDLSVEIDNHPSLTDNEKESMEGLVTFRQMSHCLKKMENDKSPGPDGFTTNFYKFFFVDIGYFLVRSINFGFLNDTLSTTQRQGVITCIPKEGKPKRFLKNWRPISLLNVSYKIASACIAERLKTVLPNIVHECQSGFLKGRYIGDNIRLVYDIMKYTECENLPGLMLMIDFEKAFDSVSWSFLHKALNFFNFGPSIQKWIKVLYNGISSCVSINGQYSSWFPISRGVRQGDPLSPYLYLICAEILSLLIRKNVDIKGIKMNAVERLISQFADDTTLFLDGSEKSFKEAIHTLNKFSKMSGLHMNTEKTQIVWIGSRKNCNIKYMRDKNFIWDPGTFRLLGVKFSTNLNEIGNLNFNDKLTTILRALQLWKKRKLTPFGKITVIKSILISKITHLLIALPDPPEQFISAIEREFESFLWEGKNKIKRTVTYSKYKEGGLQMLNVRNFLSSLKLSWLRKLRSDSDWRDFTLNLYPELIDIDKLGTEYANTVMNRINNPFWKDVMKHYKKLGAKCQVANLNEFMAECIHYNVNICRGRNVVFVREWVREGIINIRHLLNERGDDFLLYQEFQTKYPNVGRTDFLVYQGIINAVKQYKRKVGVDVSNNFKIFENKVWFGIVKGNRYIQSMLNKTTDTPTAISRWNGKYNTNLNWNKIFIHCFKTTVDTQLRWFQMRLIHRILPTERYLFVCKIVESSLCSFCNAEVESIEHLFCNCTTIRMLWNSLLQEIKRNCVHAENLHFSEQLILFGTCERTVTDRGLDLIILWTKFYIYKTKLQKRNANYNNLLQSVRNRWRIEKYAFIARGRRETFEAIWTPYRSLFVN